ncbi:MAG TPA: methyltransferase domain-containing protein, partial [Trebonia sp.]
MTTLLPEPSGPASPATAPYPDAAQSHLQRAIAEGFGTDAGRYDRARPGYPAGLVGRIAAASPGRDVLDAGCGTGIFSRLLAAAGCRVLGVDPDPRMAAAARALGTAAEVAAFEDWDPSGRSFDLVTAAQAWHWVDPAAGAAKAAAVLRPAGRLAVLWNVFEPPAELQRAFAAVYREVLPDSPAAGFWDQPALDGYRRTMGGRAADGMRRAGAFSEPEEWLDRWQRPYTRGEWLDLVPTTGGFTQRLAPAGACGPCGRPAPQVPPVPASAPSSAARAGESLIEARCRAMISRLGTGSAT